MDKMRLTVNIPGKMFSMDRKSMRLGDSFTDVSLEDIDTDEPVLILEYRGIFTEDNSPVEKEFDKLRETYGEKLFEKLNVSGNMLEGAHYLSFYGKIEPVIER